MTDKLPPYASGKVIKSAILYADILGFTDLLRSVSDTESENKLLEKLKIALDDGYQSLVGPTLLGNYSDPYSIKAFTDNIVIGYPVLDDAEIEIANLALDVAEFQIALIRHGFFIRGAIDLDNLYMDERIVFGKGIINAYDAEKRANYSRIILTEKAERAVQDHVKYYEEGHAPQRDFLLREEGSNLLFVDYLSAIFFQDDDSFNKEIIAMHKDQLEKKLKETSDNFNVYQKFLLSAAYHNHFCEKFELDYFIPPSLTAPTYFGEI